MTTTINFAVVLCSCLFASRESTCGSTCHDHLQQTIDHITTANPDAGIVIAGDLNRIDIKLTSGNLVQVVKKPTCQGAVLHRILTNLKFLAMNPRYTLQLAIVIIMQLFGWPNSIYIMMKFKMVNIQTWHSGTDKSGL